MKKINFHSFSGYVTEIQDFIIGQPEEAGCNKLVTVVNVAGAIVNFIVSPDTYVADHAMIAVGDIVTGYYDGNAPTILIYPPQYPAIVMVKVSRHREIKVNFFNQNLESSDGQLQLNLTPSVPILLTNGQVFSNHPSNRNLVVFYGPATKSIPAQTTPYKIIVLC
ncbi:hypothetical protein N8498_04200 [Candidatus Pseudothioglobus singularis]|nr:hypothetical protein [Candidatus Pseudothioglobus singularis]